MNTVDVVVGKRIRASRRALGMSQADLGRAIGVRFQQVQKYETGANRVSASRLWAIADVLGVDVTQFFDGIEPVVASGVGKDARTQDTMSYLSDSEKLELVELFSALPSMQRQAVLAIVRSMADSEAQAALTTAT